MNTKQKKKLAATLLENQKAAPRPVGRPPKTLGPNASSPIVDTVHTVQRVKPKEGETGRVVLPKITSRPLNEMEDADLVAADGPIAQMEEVTKDMPYRVIYNSSTGIKERKNITRDFTFTEEEIATNRERADILNGKSFPLGFKDPSAPKRIF